jgi:hypothetical protein
MLMRKSQFVALALGVTCTSAGVVMGGLLAQGLASGSGTPKPEVDRANATIQLGAPAPLTGIRCLGEDKTASGAKTPYITYSGTWSGGETESVAGESDYPLSGTLTVSGISWTINLLTDRGVLTGKAVLTTPPGTTTQTLYSGRLVLVTQGDPSATSAPTSGRGYITAGIPLPDEVTTPGDDGLLANVEFPSLSLGSAVGSFGDVPAPSPSVPDFSVVTNVPPRGTQAC